MGTFLQIPEMDINNKIPILVFLIMYTNYVSGLYIPKSEKLEVHILDGEVIVVWDPAVDASSKARYNVHMAKYSSGDWAMVASCTSVTVTYCDLTNLIDDYSAAYKVKVQLVTEDNMSDWTAVKRFYPNKSELQPPSFTLKVTSSTITVEVHQKPILRKLFPYGVTYTIYLEERGEDKKNTTAYLTNDYWEDECIKTFDSLHWGREYCVSVMVEGKGALSSAMSPKHCLLLPEQEWFIMAVSSLSVLGILAMVAVVLIIIFFYLRRPEKTPGVLQSPRTGWVPLSFEEGHMEVVTDKAWFLALSRPEIKNCVSKQPVSPQDTVTTDNEQEDRRTSMDSGVEMELNRRSPPLKQEDSGCGSMGGSESSTSCNSQTEEHALLDGRTNIMIARKREDSGVGLGCQLDCSVNLDVQDSESLKESDSGGNYHSQSPSSVQTEVCDSEEVFKQMLPDSLLANVVTGYRAGHFSCICSGAGQCTWCHKRDNYGTDKIRQNRATCIENQPVNSINNAVDAYKGKHVFPICSKKPHMQIETGRMDDSDTSSQISLTHLGEDFPLLKALSSLPLVEEGQDFSMTNLSLCDIELKND